MKQRGRQSAVALETLTGPAVLDRVDRQKPPHDLSDEECEVWAGIVNSEPADWFSPATVPILAQMCRHCVHARRIAELLDKATSDPSLTVQDYNRLLHMQERESRCITLLATKMRLTQKSTIHPSGNKKKTAARKPWEG